MDPFLSIALVTFSVGAIFGYFIAAARARRLYLTGIAAFFAATVGLVVAMDQATGWDGLGYLFILIAGVAPAAAGYLGGGVAGFVRSQPKPT